MSDLPRQYHGDGPILPGESWHQALGENTAASLAGHLVRESPKHLLSGYYDDPSDEEPGGGLTHAAENHPGESSPPGLQETKQASHGSAVPRSILEWQPPIAMDTMDVHTSAHTPADYKSEAPPRGGTSTPRGPQSGRPRRGPVRGPLRPRG